MVTRRQGFLHYPLFSAGTAGRAEVAPDIESAIVRGDPWGYAPSGGAIPPLARNLLNEPAA